jgi:hypothetical protein
MSRPKLEVAVSLLTGNTTLTVHAETWTHIAAGLATVSDEKANIVHIACCCSAQACRRYRNMSHMFLKPKDLENRKVNSLICLLANTRLSSTIQTVKGHREDLHVVC